VIDSYDVFHYGSITLIDEPSRSATLAAIDHARGAGKLISYDPNLRMSLWENADAARAGMLAGLKYAHIVKVSEEELDFLLPGVEVIDDDPVAALWRENTRLICVTRGANGAILYTRDGKRAESDGFKVSTVDTTGAGDSFVAALLTEIGRRGDEWDQHLNQIVRFACAAGALTTTGRGAIPSLPTRAQVNAFLNG